MRKLSTFVPTKWWSRMTWVLVTYIIAADFLPNLLMFIINCSGYLPYSDRPGPGWQTPHWPQRSELSFFFGFALYMGIPTLLYGFGQTLLAFVYEICSLPRWLIRILGAVTGFLAAGLLMEGAGWMIAISALGVYLAAGCGILWGIFVLPLLVSPPRSLLLPFALRVVFPVAVFCAGVGYLIYPLLPKTPVAAVVFELLRVTDGPDPIPVDTTSFLRPETHADVNALHLRGKVHGGLQIGEGSQDQDYVDVVVFALQGIDREYKLDVPTQGHVVYVLADGKLTAHPAVLKKSKREVLIEPGVDSTYDGGRIKIGSKADFSAFTWYPAIRR